MVRAANAAFLVLGIIACQPERLVLSPISDPYIYIPINQRSFYGDQRALLLTMGAPKRMVERSAQQFELTRSRDGAKFVWNNDPLPYAQFCAAGCPLEFGNYVLPDSSSGASLGATDLAAGDTLLLTIVTEGVVVTGQAVLPYPPQPSVVMRGSERVIVWNRVAGVTHYIVDSQGLVPKIQADTEFVVPNLAPGDSAGVYEFTVKTLDANLATFLTDKTIVRSGIAIGYGAFGAVNAASVLVPRP